MTTTTDLTAAARKVREWTARRNRLICQRRDEGATQRQIGAEAGLSKTAIQKILEREDVRRAS